MLNGQPMGSRWAATTGRTCSSTDCSRRMSTSSSFVSRVFFFGVAPFGALLAFRLRFPFASALPPLAGAWMYEQFSPCWHLQDSERLPRWQ